MTRILSGVQPTGNLHLGNYLGAIKQWVDVQYEHDCLFMLADLHAITLPQNPDDLRASVLKTTALYIACGIDPKKSVIFNQSKIAGHSELAWILGCNTPLGWLDRMTQFKDKAGKDKQRAALGLYSYPVLMAADILLYNADLVPVGDDQKQHLELARDIAAAFNRNYACEFFTIPEPMILKTAARVMSLRDGKKKMSKSDPSDQSRINLTDSADEIQKKIRKATTDNYKGITYNPQERAEISNLLAIISGLYGKDVEENAKQYEYLDFQHFKQIMAELVITKIEPITKEFHKLMENQDFLLATLQSGAGKASEIAEKNMKQIKGIVGFI